jgi:hypothetical protein
LDRRIVWINGAFGVGKTSVARTLVTRLGNATLLDPEVLGLALQRFHFGRVEDFQNLPSWRRWTVRFLELASKARSRIVVPMTLVNRVYFDQIVGTLRRCCDGELRHFALIAPREVVVERLRRRGEAAGGWAEIQIGRCVGALASAEFADHVPTAGRSVDDVVDDILGRLGAGPTSQTLSFARGRSRRSRRSVR